MIQNITDAYDVNLTLIIGDNPEISVKLLHEFEAGVYILNPQKYQYKYTQEENLTFINAKELIDDVLSTIGIGIFDLQLKFN